MTSEPTSSGYGLMLRCTRCGTYVLAEVGVWRYLPELSFFCRAHEATGDGFRQVDRFTRRFCYRYADAVSLHDYAVRAGHIASLRTGPDPLHLEIIVIKAAGWLRLSAA